MLTKFFSFLGLGSSKQQVQKNEEIKKSGLLGAVEMKDRNANGGNRRKASKRKRKASKRKASKRKREASKRNASKRKRNASRRK